MCLALVIGMRDRIVMCAVDLGPMTRRVLFHAGALARVFDANLAVVHVNGVGSKAAHERVLRACLADAPYEIPLDERNIVVTAGRVSDMIQREARRINPLVLAIGSRSHSGIARLLLGSTSEAVLKQAPAPVLLIPPTDMDIVTLGDPAALTCGPVLAAVDLLAHCDRQLAMAERMAALARRPLLLMTVAKSRVTDRLAVDGLHDRARAAGIRPHALIVRRGNPVEEVSRCALVEGAGLVVMGIDTRPRRQPGSIASAVLKTRRAFVMAVPGC